MIKKILLLIVAAYCLFVQSIIHGQNITGKVIEKGTTTYGIKNATVKVYSNNVKIPDITTTDTDGNFHIALTDVLETEQELTGAYSGYNQLRIKTRINGKGKLTLYNILGQEILRRKINGGGGIQEVKIPIAHLANGVYPYKIEDDEGIQTINKFAICNGYVNPGKSGLQTSSGESSVNRKRLSKNTDYWNVDSISVSGTNIETIVTKNFLPQTGNSYNVGTIEAEGKNTITGYLYDLDTKYTTKTGIKGAKAYLKSTPEKNTTTDNNGNYTLKTANSGTDTLIIEDTTYYNWKHPVEIQPGNNNITAFNDNTGIPMIRRYNDPDNKEDLIEFTQKITDINSKWIDNPTYINTTPRFKNKTVLVYLNRKNAPNSWYPDSAYAGFKHIENDQLKFEETTDSASAQIHMLYTNPNVGNGTNLIGGSDEQGPYIKNWDINIRGNKDYTGGTQNPLQPIIVSYVIAHEAGHAIFSSGEHSQYPKDILYLSPLSRYYDFNIKTFGSEKEINAKKIIYTLERNPKLLEYYK